MSKLYPYGVSSNSKCVLTHMLLTKASALLAGTGAAVAAGVSPLNIGASTVLTIAVRAQGGSVVVAGFSEVASD